MIFMIIWIDWEEERKEDALNITTPEIHTVSSLENENGKVIDPETLRLNIYTQHSPNSKTNKSKSLKYKIPGIPDQNNKKKKNPRGCCLPSKKRRKPKLNTLPNANEVKRKPKGQGCILF